MQTILEKLSLSYSYLKNIFSIIRFWVIVKLITLLIISSITYFIFTTDIFYVIVETYLENKYPNSSLLTYIRMERVKHFHEDENEIISIIKENTYSQDKNSHWRYSIEKNRSILLEAKEKVTDSNDFQKIVSLYDDLDKFYFKLITFEYKFDLQKALKELDTKLSKYKCNGLIQVIDKYDLDFRKIIARPIISIVNTTLYWTQTLKMDEKQLAYVLNKDYINADLVRSSDSYGYYFLNYFFMDRCIEAIKEKEKE